MQMEFVRIDPFVRVTMEKKRKTGEILRKYSACGMKKRRIVLSNVVKEKYRVCVI